MTQRQDRLVAIPLLLLATLAATGCVTGASNVPAPRRVAAPKTHLCRVASSPPGAFLMANGVGVGTTPCSIAPDEIPCFRNFEIVAEFPGYYPASRSFDTWIEGLPSYIQLQLTPLQDKASTPTSVPECDLGGLPIVRKRASVAILDFRVDENLSLAVGESLADFCRETVQDSNRFLLVDREEMRILLSEQDLTAAIQCDDTRCLVNYGRKLRAQKIMYGRAVRVGSAFILTLRMVDVGSGEIQAIKTAKVGDSADYLVDFISPLTCQLLYDALSQ